MGLSEKITRTVRIRNIPSSDPIHSLYSVIADAGGRVDRIKIISTTTLHIVRDVIIHADSVEQFNIVLNSMREKTGAIVMNVRDDILALHFQGKIAIHSRFLVNSTATLRKVYTPGVAEVCLKIASDLSLARTYTSIGRMVAIVTDGTAILGLGDIGPVAGMPVMEGKAMLMETLVGLSGIPILLDTKDVDQIVETVVTIAPTFAAIQLEDISAPRCFEIEQRLQKRLNIPVLHDDQHGTAAVVTAALMVASRRTGVYLSSSKIGQIGLGAAGFAIAKMVMGLTGNQVWGTDLNQDALRRLASAGGRPSNLREIMENCDIVVATTGVAGLIKPEMVRKGQIILALSNPNSEIDPQLAIKRGALFAADGKMVNNVLGFPGIFRGAVDANASRISTEMLLAAARAIADMAPPDELVPNPLDKKVHQAVARAVAKKAFEQGIARAEYVAYADE